MTSQNQDHRANRPIDSGDVLLGGALAWVAAAAVSVLLCRADLPCPRGDDAFYKSPAAELVLTGRLVQPSVVGYLPRADEAFAAYPPVYQLVVAGWFKAFGFSLRSSVAFGHFVHLANMALLMTLVASVTASAMPSAPLRTLVVVAVGITYFGQMRLFDRQEELAVLLAAIELTAHQRGWLIGFRGSLVSGILLGLCGMISPWAGLVLAGLFTIRAGLEPFEEANGPASRSWWRATALLAVIALSSLAPVVVWIVWLEVNHPGIFVDQFVEHLRRSEKTTLWQAPADLWNCLLYSPYQLPAVLFTLAFFPRLLTRGGWRRNPTMTALFLGATVGLVVTILFRTNSYNYFWYCLILLFPCFGFTACRLLTEANRLERTILIAIVALCSLISLRDPVSLSLVAFDLPAEERPAPIHARLTRLIPREDLVATTSRYWYWFQGRNRWRNAAIVEWLDEADRLQWQWIVIPVGHGMGDSAFRRRLTGGFELVERIESDYRTWAPSFPLEDRTWAYELYRRRPDG